MATKYTKAQAKEFIRTIGPIIQSEGFSRGYDVVSTTIAQAVIESAAGVSGLARYHNYFGLKCGSSWKGKSVNMKTKEEYNSQLVTINDNFRVYDNMVEGVRGYYSFIGTKRYENLKYAADYRQFAEYLKKDGYATSSSYVNTLVNCVKGYGLTSYDRKGEVIAVHPTLRKGNRGAEVRLLQETLNKYGYNLTVDGIFGEMTRQAVCHFQIQRGLECDGIVGRYTWKELFSS